MYGVSKNLTLGRFVGATLIDVEGTPCLYFHFSSDLLIGVEGRWILRDERRELLCWHERQEEQDLSKMHEIIGKVVAGYEIQAPHSFTLFFSNGFSLMIYDDSDRYESFYLQPGDVFV